MSIITITDNSDSTQKNATWLTEHIPPFSNKQYTLKHTHFVAKC
jgi:hypothetical protein